LALGTRNRPYLRWSGLMTVMYLRNSKMKHGIFSIMGIVQKGMRSHLKIHWVPPEGPLTQKEILERIDVLPIMLSTIHR